MQAKVHAGGLDLSFWTMLGTSSEGVDPASCMTWARNYVTGSCHCLALQPHGARYLWILNSYMKLTGSRDNLTMSEYDEGPLCLEYLKCL